MKERLQTLAGIYSAAVKVYLACSDNAQCGCGCGPSAL